MKIRRAGEADSEFLATVILLATRAHLSKGWFDILLGQPEEDCLTFIAHLARSPVRSWWHCSRFWIAEIRETPAAALCAFRAGEAYPLSGDAISHIAAELGYSVDQQKLMWERGSYIFSCTVGGGDELWTLENIATLLAHRRQGLATALIETALDEGRAQDCDRVQVTTFIGNEPAIRAYKSLGFELIEEKRNETFESVAGAPGLCRLERVL